MPSTKANIEPVQKLRSLNAVRSTIGWRAVAIRQKKATPLTAEIRTAIVTSWLSNQSFDGPSSSAYSIAPRKPAIVSSPT